MSGNQCIIRSPKLSCKPVGSWIDWYTSQPGKDFLCRVPVDFIADNFNLTGLEFSVPNFNLALSVILNTKFGGEVNTEQAETLYGLIHARYIVTVNGVESMCRKYEKGDFGICPRFYCKGQNTLPVGLSDICGHSCVKLYCPRCGDIFQPRSRCCQLDGAHFGTNFPHMFFMQLPELRPQPPEEKYKGRLYGFVVHKSALIAPESPDCKNGKKPASRLYATISRTH